MIILETGLFWRRVGKRFEARVNAAEKQGYGIVAMYSNQFDMETSEPKRSLIQLRLILVAQMVLPKA